MKIITHTHTHTHTFIPIIILNVCNKYIYIYICVKKIKDLKIPRLAKTELYKCLYIKLFTYL